MRYDASLVGIILMKRVLCAAALSILAAAPAQAEKCSLPLVASLDLTPLSSGTYSIPVSVGGVERKFELGLNKPFSAITGTLADSLGYESVKLSRNLEPRLGAEKVERRVIVGDLAVGLSHGKDFQMLRSDTNVAERGVDGVAGLDLLQNYDVELDLKARKLKLFSPNDCQNKAYWSSSLAETKFTADLSGHIEFAMTLDSRKVTVDFDVSEGAAVMGTNTLKRLFDLTPQSPGMVAEMHGTTPYWHYPFTSLSMEGIAINNPHIVILQQDGPECRHQFHAVGGRMMQCFGASDLLLRSRELRQLHLYFDFKHKVLYATAADASMPETEPAK